MAEHGINAVRTYTASPRWVLDAAKRSGLFVTSEAVGGTEETRWVTSGWAWTRPQRQTPWQVPLPKIVPELTLTVASIAGSPLPGRCLRCRRCQMPTSAGGGPLHPLLAFLLSVYYLKDSVLLWISRSGQRAWQVDRFG